MGKKRGNLISYFTAELCWLCSDLEQRRRLLPRRAKEMICRAVVKEEGKMLSGHVSGNPEIISGTEVRLSGTDQLA